MAASSSSSCSPALLQLLLFLAVSAGTGASEAPTTTTTTSATPPAPPSAPATALDQVCGRLGSYYVTPSLCLSALCGADASSQCRAARDAPAVAALAARLAADNATAARDSIQAVFSPSSPSSSSSNSGATTTAAATASAARSCLELYAGAVPALRWAARAVAAGRYRGAREVLQAAQFVAAGCEGMAGDAAAALPRENGGFADMAFVAHAVVASMSTN